MSGGDINGDAAAIRQFVAQVTGSLDASSVSRLPWRDPRGAMSCGLGHVCDELARADNESTRMLHGFAVQVTQGLAASNSFVQRTAARHTAPQPGRQNASWVLVRLDDRRVNGIPILASHCSGRPTRAGLACHTSPRGRRAWGALRTTLSHCSTRSCRG